MRLRYYAHYGSTGGYGRAARDYIAALGRVEGIELEVVNLDKQLPAELPDVRDDRRVVQIENVAVNDRTQDVALYHAAPWVLEALACERGLELGTTQSIALTTWETNRLPVDCYKVLDHHFDGFIVPSHFVADALYARVEMAASELQKPIDERQYEYRSISDKPIHVVPHCFDEAEWERLNPKRWTEGQPTRFYTIGAWGERKNTLGLLRAYLHAFTRADNVELLVLLDSKANFDEIEALLARSGIPRDQMPKITIPEPRRYTDFEILSIHSEADCYVTATRGEGWGLGMFEAALIGNDVIAPRYGGQLDFLLGYPRWHEIAYQLTPCFGGEDRERVAQNNGHMMQVSRVTIPRGVDCRQLWAEPDLSDLAAKMFRVYVESQGANFHTFDRSPARLALEERFEYSVVGPQLATTLRNMIR